MAGKDSPQDVIDSYRKRQQVMPFILGGLAIVLVVVGVIILVVWLAGPDRPAIATRPSETPTVTEIPTETPVTPTMTETIMPTDTIEPTATETTTPSGPFEYTVQDDDNCWNIAVQFDVDLPVLQALNDFGSDCPIIPGQVILIPAPGQTLPTETPLPTGMAYGTKVEYTVKTGDTLALIASKLNTTMESIMDDNDIDDANTIYVGQLLTIRVNIVTPTITLAPTGTSDPAAVTPTVEATATP